MLVYHRDTVQYGTSMPAITNLVISSRDKWQSKSFYSLYYESIVIEVPKGLVPIWGIPRFGGVTFRLMEGGKIGMKLYKTHLFIAET